jgi:hypothetical protein
MAKQENLTVTLLIPGLNFKEAATEMLQRAKFTVADEQGMQFVGQTINEQTLVVNIMDCGTPNIDPKKISEYVANGVLLDRDVNSISRPFVGIVPTASDVKNDRVSQDQLKDGKIFLTKKSSYPGVTLSEAFTALIWAAFSRPIRGALTAEWQFIRLSAACCWACASSPAYGAGPPACVPGSPFR